jgi:hypothetical protein
LFIAQEAFDSTTADAEYYSDLAAGYAATAEDASDTAVAASGTAVAAWDDFDDTYLGSKSSDPTLDNDGGALATGALYWNSVSHVLKAYNGASWTTVQVGTSTYWATSIAGTNTITGSVSGYAAYAAGDIIAFIPANTNTGAAVTININSLGAVNLKRAGSATTLVAADLRKDVMVQLQYDGTYFNILSPLSGAHLSVTSYTINTPYTVFSTYGTPKSCKIVARETAAAAYSSIGFANPSGNFCWNTYEAVTNGYCVHVRHSGTMEAKGVATFPDTGGVCLTWSGSGGTIDFTIEAEY